MAQGTPIPLYGLAVDRPAATAIPDGSTYYATDTEVTAQVQNRIWLTQEIAATDLPPSVVSDSSGPGGGGANHDVPMNGHALTVTYTVAPTVTKTPVNF